MNEEKTFTVGANVISDRGFRTGAKVQMLRVDGDADNPLMVGLSKSGRRIKKRIPFKRLENFRPSFVPDDRRSTCSALRTKTDCQIYCEQLTQLWSGVRSFMPDGSLIRDGLTRKQSEERIEPLN